MSRKQVLITCPVDRQLLEPLENRFEFVFPDTANAQISVAEQASEALRSTNVVIAELDVVDEETVAASPSLELVISCRASPVNIDLQACAVAGVPVCTTPGRNADATADLTFGLILDTMRRITEASMWMRGGNWKEGVEDRPYRRFRGPTLSGRTIGIVGGGAVGLRVARRALGFGMSVVIYDPYLSTSDLPAGCELATLEDLLLSSDVVTVHVPLTEDTIGLIDAAAIKMMRPGSYLINAARAAIVDQDAMLRAVQSQHLAGVGLDVYPEEPPAIKSSLFDESRVVLTPHIAGASSDVIRTQTSMVVEILTAHFNGDPLPYPARNDLVDFRKVGTGKSA